MRHLLRRATRRREAGFGLVEVMVACLVLGIMSAAVVGVILQAQSAGVTNRSRIAASNLAAREIDMVRDEFHRTKTAPADIAEQGTVVNPHQLDGGIAGQPLVVDSRPYTVTRSVQWNITGNGQSACDGGALVIYPTLQVTVAVTWPRMGSVQPVTATTQLAPDKGAGIPNTDSFVAVRVKNSTGQPSVGRNVKVSGGSDSVTGITDGNGCAVLEVSPAAGTGTSYTAQVLDAGYVDISSTPQPSKAVGFVSQGQLNNSVSFSVAQPGTATIHLVDSAGNAVPSGTANGLTVTVVASEYSGASPATSYTLTGSTLTLNNLWPTQYGAYYGTSAPPAGYTAKDLAPGGSIDLDAVLQVATTTIDSLPTGTTKVIAAPAGASSCTDAGAVQVTPGAVSLLPGDWAFFAVGEGNPAFACSPGPGSGTQSPITLAPGPNDGISWGTTNLTVTGSVPAGTLYAIDPAKAGNLGAACPAAALDASAITLNSSGTTLPAGSWYVYSRNGATCRTPAGLYPYTVPYGTTTTLSWPANSVKVTVSGIEVVTGSTRPGVYLSSSNDVGTSGHQVTCSNGGAMTSVSATLLNLGTPSSAGGSVSATVAQGTWYVYGTDPRTFGSGRWSPSCTLAGTVTVGSSSGALTIDYSTSAPGTVGP